MKTSKYSEEQIIGFLSQGEAGMPIKGIGRKHGFSDGSFHKWRSKCGGMYAAKAKRLRELELENGKLKRRLAEAHLDIHALKSVFGTKLGIYRKATQDDLEQSYSTCCTT